MPAPAVLLIGLSLAALAVILLLILAIVVAVVWSDRRDRREFPVADTQNWRPLLEQAPPRPGVVPAYRLRHSDHVARDTAPTAVWPSNSPTVSQEAIR